MRKNLAASGFGFGLQGLDEIVAEAWNKPLRSPDPIRNFHAKLSRTATALKKWNNSMRKKASLATDIANEVIFQLDLSM